MNAKEFLEQVRYVDRAIDSKLEQVHRLRNEATKATSLVSDMPRGGSPNLQHLEDTIVKIIDLEHEINQDIDRLVDMKTAARVRLLWLLTACGARSSLPPTRLFALSDKDEDDLVAKDTKPSVLHWTGGFCLSIQKRPT